jgi:hypothetical protein
MKTKVMILGVVLTGFITGQAFAQVDTTKKKEKTDTVWNKEPRDTSTKKDTNQVSSNEYIRPSDNLINAKNAALVSAWNTQPMINNENKWYVRKEKGEEEQPMA